MAAIASCRVCMNHSFRTAASPKKRSKCGSIARRSNSVPITSNTITRGMNSPWTALGFDLLLSAVIVPGRIQDILDWDITELPAEHMFLVLLHGRDVTAHHIQDAHVLAVKDLALQQAQDLDSVFTLDKEREEWEQLVVQPDKFVPDLHAASQRALVGFEGRFAEVARFQCGPDRLGAKSGAVHSDADPR